LDFSLDANYDQNNDSWNISLTGEIDMFNSDEFKARLVELTEKKHSSLNIDCKYLDYIDSTGLGVLVSVFKSVSGTGGDVRILNPNKSLKKLFAITNLDKVFSMGGDE